MKKITAGGRHDNKRIDTVITDMFRDMSKDTLYKAFRHRDIKVNGKRVKFDHKVRTGDSIEVYIADAALEGLSNIQGNPGFWTVYEDDNLIIVNKERGIPVQSMEDSVIEPLETRVRKRYADSPEAGGIRSDMRFPALCHRLDKNTSGLVILARNADAWHLINDRLRKKQIRKFYQCICSGRPQKDEDTINAYLVKDKETAKVYVSMERMRNSLQISTRYRVLGSNGELSRLEVELLTGRTHQIRAHLAYMGHPILGDGKYGSNELNRQYKIKQQALCACKLDFTSGARDRLSYLDGKIVEIPPDFGISGIRGINDICGII